VARQGISELQAQQQQSQIQQAATAALSSHVHLAKLGENYKFLAGMAPYSENGYPALAGNGAIPRYTLQKEFSAFFHVTTSAFSNYLSSTRPNATPRTVERAIALRYGFGPDTEFAAENGDLHPLALCDKWFTDRWPSWRGGDAAKFRSDIADALRLGTISPLAETDRTLIEAIAAVGPARAHPIDGHEQFASSSAGHSDTNQRSHAPRRSAGNAWSASWTEAQVADLIRAVSNLTPPIHYIYSARASGKSILLTALVDELTRSATNAIHLVINLHALVESFAEDRDTKRFHDSILEEVRAQIARRRGIDLASNPATGPDDPSGDSTISLGQRRFSFNDRMEAALSAWPSGPIFLVIEAADACLRIRDLDLRNNAKKACKTLFAFLQPLAENSAKPVCAQLTVLVEGSRPLADLVGSYAGSMNKAHEHILPRFDESACRELAGLAGTSMDDDYHQLWIETGGHRTLVWAVLSSAVALPGSRLPADLSSIDVVAKRTRWLIDELKRQPDAYKAMSGILAGSKVDLESITRLRHAMYLDDLNQPNCPLLVRALQAEIAQ
jgi:hypothetical protein